LGLRIFIDFSLFSKYLRSVNLTRRRLALLPVSFLLIWTLFGSFIPSELCMDAEPCCCSAAVETCCDPVRNESDGCCLQIDAYFCLPACTPAGFFEVDFQMTDLCMALGKTEWPMVQSYGLYQTSIWRPPAASILAGNGVLRI
jgi:hypothetical protein